MPSFNVTGPDGKTYRVNAPAGATQQDAIAYVATTYYSGGAAQAPAQTPAAPPASLTPQQQQAVAQREAERGFFGRAFDALFGNEIEAPKAYTPQEIATRGREIRDEQRRLEAVAAENERLASEAARQYQSPNAPDRALGFTQRAQAAREQIAALGREFETISQTGLAVPEASTTRETLSSLFREPAAGLMAIPGGIEYFAGRGLGMVGADRLGKYLTETGASDIDVARQYAESAFGAPGEALQYDPTAQLAADVAGGVGTVASFLLPGGAARLAGAGRGLQGAARAEAIANAARPAEYGLGIMQGTQQGIQDIRSYEQRTGQQVPDANAFAAILFNAGLGATEVGVAGRIFERIPVAQRGAALDAVSNVVRRGTAGRVDPTAIGQAVARTLTDIESRALGRVAVRGTEEALQEMGVQMGTNLAAQQLYDPERGITEGAGYAALVGGIVGGGLRGGVEVAQKVFGPRGDVTPEGVPIAPQIKQEFQRLAAQEVAAVMAANPGMDQKTAVEAVAERAEELLTRAAANTVARGEGGAGVGPTAGAAVDVSGGVGAGVAPNLQPTPPQAGAPELGEAVAGGLGEPVPSVSVPDVGARAGEPALTPTELPKITGAQIKATVPTIEQAFADNSIDFEDSYGVKKLNAEQKKQAARIVLQSPEVDPYDAIGSVLERGQRLRGEPVAPKPVATAPTAIQEELAARDQEVSQELVAPEAQPTPTVAETATVEKVTPPAQKTLNDLAGVGTVNPENTNEVLVEGGGVQLTPVGEDIVQLDSIRAIEKGGGRKAMSQLIKAADENATTIQLSPEPFAAPAGKEMTPIELTEWYKGFGFQEQPDGSMVRPSTRAPSITPQPEYTPQQVVDNIEVFAAEEARDRGFDPGMFREGAVDAVRGREPLTDQQILAAQGQEALDAYKAGTQFAQDRVADAAKSATTEAEVDPAILAKRDELREKIMAAPGDTIRQKIIGLMSKETNEALKAAKTPEELAKLLGLDETSPIMDEVLRGEAGIDDERMKDILRNLYQGSPDQMAHICVKEILQNSHDAVRDALRMGLITEGFISFQVSEDGLTFTTTDNGKGMSPQVLQGPFLKVGSTGKGADGESHSGGYGLAKTLFLYGNKAIKVITANNGIVSTMETSGEELGKAFVTRDPNDQPLIYTRPFEPDDYDIFPEGHGTKLTLTLPTQDIDPEANKLVDVTPLPDYPSTFSLPGMGHSPLFSPVNVTYQKEGDIQYRVDIGSRFPYADFAEFAQVKLPSGTAVIYASRQPKKYAGMDNNVHILSDGVWQFSKGINVPGSYWEKIPYDFYINYIADPAIKPDNPLYPFAMDRKTFSSAGDKTYNNLAAILLKNYGLEDLYKDAKSFGTIQYFDPNTQTLGAVVDLTPEIPEIETGFGKLQGGTDIVLGSDGRVAINGQEVNPEDISDISSRLPKSSSLIIDQNKIDPNKVMVHENADVVYTDKDGVERQVPIMEFLRETFGTKVDDFYYFMGDAFQQLRNEVADIMEYPALKTEAVGISVDPGYRGVSIKVPFSGMFINPLVPEAPAGPRALFGIVTTMIHELAHYKVRNHDAGFPAEMQRIQAALEASAFEQGFDFPAWKQRFVERAIDAGYVDLIRAGQNLFETRKDRESYHGNPEYTNVRVVYRGQRFKDGAAEQVPDEGRAGPDGTPDTGAVGAGEGAGERLLGPAYEGREGAGGRGQPEAGAQGGTEPVTDANVDQVLSVKLTKGQLKRLEEAAGIRRMQLSNMQRRIVKSRSAEEALTLSGKLMLLARGQNDDVNLLTSLFNSVPPPLLQKLLGPMMTEDVVRLAERAGMENISQIDDMIRNEYTPYINRLMQDASAVSERWTDFASRFEEGNQALADVMYIANMYDVDPTLASSAAEYAKVDTKLIELAAKLAAEKDTKKKNALKGQISRRRGEIQRVYYGGADPDTGAQVYGWNDLSDAKMGGGAGKRIFRLARDHYRNTFEEHYRLLMERIDTSQFENEKAVELKSAVDEMFAKARARSIYFPLKRFGEYWVSVGKGQNSEFYLFESLGDQQDFIRKIKAEGETRFIDFSQGKDTLRKGLHGKAADASVALRNILDKIEGDNITDVDILKDNIFQMYLMALPEADMRRRFIHREFKTGFSTDALRTFASTAVASASQLGRLAYNYRLKNLIDASYAETAGNVSKARLDTLTREIEMRVESIMSPDINGWFDQFVSVNAKGTFLFFLSGVKSAAMNLTQLHIVGLPTLSAEFGEKATYGMAARYTAELATGKRIAIPFRDEDGNVRLEFPKFTAEDSRYIRGLQKTDPDRYAAMQKAWEYAKTHDVTESTFSSGADIYERSDLPTGDFGAVQALRRGEVLTAAQRATGNAINAMGGLFHSTERIGREIMYMSAFELAYERNLKEGMDPAAAGDAAMKQADKLTRKAMFDFTNWNKSRYSKAPVGRLALQMRSYSITMSSLLFRSFYGMLPYFNKEGKVASAKVFFGVGAMTALYGGFRVTQFSVLAMLGYGLLNFVKDMFGDDDDEEEEVAGGYLTDETIQREMLKYADDKGRELSRKDMEYYIRSAWIPDTFGPGGTLATKLGIPDGAARKLETVADIGLPGLFNVDLSSSVSLGDLWHPVSTKSDDPTVRMFEFVGRAGLGATGSMYASFLKSWQQFNAGDLDKAIETGMPAMIRNFIKGQRLREEGLVVGADRDVVLKDPSYYDTYKVAMQSLGFGDAETSRNMQLDIAATDIEKEVSAEATTLLSQRYRAARAYYLNPTPETTREFQEVERAISIYNLNYPSNEITEADKQKSYASKSEDAAQREGGLGYNPRIPVRQSEAERRAAELGQ